MTNRQTHILVVDDSADDLEMFSQYLSMQGYRVDTAEDGREGVDTAFELQPDLILMDLWLPIMSGWEAMQRLKTHEKTKHIPIIIVTGHSLVRPLESDGWLIKPFPLDQLDVEIERVLEAHGGVETRHRTTARIHKPRS